ncbi:MAG: CDP-alcohol phosphatidyltransferase family protein [Candidatus Omnitrophica bacterium]|nr:CDP-alcohol phosphatidyltransferase family protein [Candidatus Omnitrophota bacterium]
MNVPNILTMSRLLLVPSFFLVMYYYFAGQDGMLLWARVILLFIVASDFFDGYIARIRGEMTSLGSVLDPIADKLFVTASFILLAVYDLVPAWLTIIVVAKDILVSIGWCAIAVLFQKMEVKPTFLGKLATALQYGTVCIIVLLPPHTPLWGLEYATGAATLLALLHYGGLAAQHNNGSSHNMTINHE